LGRGTLPTQDGLFLTATKTPLFIKQAGIVCSNASGIELQSPQGQNQKQEVSRWKK
jgi:hypothetical protein